MSNDSKCNVKSAVVQSQVKSKNTSPMSEKCAWFTEIIRGFPNSIIYQPVKFDRLSNGTDD